MRNENEIRRKFEAMKKRLKPWDEDDVEGLYWAEALAWVLHVKCPPNVTKFEMAEAQNKG